MNIVFTLSSRVPNFIEQSHLEATEAWSAYWTPILKTLAHQCLNPCRSLRQQALTSLQRTLLSSSLASPDHAEWTAIFSDVLFPLITQLLKPEVYQSDPLGMSETRVRAATLLSKVFLHYLVLLSGTNELFDLWLKIITILDRLGNSGQGDNLEEAVSENLKNMLLVMNDGGYLNPPEVNPEQEELWIETWKRINRFQPGLLAELFPNEVGKPPRGNKAKVEDKDAGKSEGEAETPAQAREMDVAIRGGKDEAKGDVVEDGETVAEKEG